MLWFRTPEKVYFKKGCMPVALDELGTIMHKKKAFIVTDSFLYNNGYVKPIEAKLDEMGIKHTCFFEVAPDPTLQCAREGAAQMTAFEPDTIIAVGGGSAMDEMCIRDSKYTGIPGPPYGGEGLNGRQGHGGNQGKGFGSVSEE